MSLLNSIDFENMTKDEFENYDVSKFSSDELYKFIDFYLDVHSDVDKLNLTRWNVSRLKYVWDLFRCRKNLKKIDITGWDVSNVENMYQMFFKCYELEEVVGLSSLDVSKAENMCGMFYECHNLKKIDVSRWDTRNVKHMDYMFDRCEELEEIVGLQFLNVSNIVNGHCITLFRCFNLDYFMYVLPFLVNQ